MIHDLTIHLPDDHYLRIHYLTIMARLPNFLLERRVVAAGARSGALMTRFKFKEL
jgi:hypothetical protein